MNIKTKEMLYFGYRQGFKVYVNGKKFPIQYKHWYTNMIEQDAINIAIKEAQYEAIVCRKDHSKEGI